MTREPGAPGVGLAEHNSCSTASPRGPVERRKLRVLTQLGELCIHGTFLSSTPPPPEGLGSGIQDGVAESSWARDEPSGPEATRPLHHQHRRPHGPGRTVHLLPQGQPVGECLARPLPLKGAAPTDLGRGRSGRPEWRRRGQGLEESLPGA